MKRTKDELIKEVLNIETHYYKSDLSYTCRNLIQDIIAAINTTEIVETPEPVIDSELEEVKKKFPVGRWFINSEKGATIYKVHDVIRRLHIGLVDCTDNWHPETLCTPFEFPVASVWKSIDQKPTEAGLCLFRCSDAHDPCFAYYMATHDEWRVNGMAIRKGRGMQWCELPNDEVTG